jgi:hypothetical protein
MQDDSGKSGVRQAGALGPDTIEARFALPRVRLGPPAVATMEWHSARRCHGLPV